MNNNWDMAATSQCGYASLSIPQGWPHYAPEMAQPTGPGCIYKDPCAWDTKWHGVGCVDPCYAPTDGDNCVFGRVTQVSLRQNSLEGTIPEKFFDELINMTVVDLGYNYLSGTIPTELGKVRNLRTLDLNNNVLTGTLPTEIAHLGAALGFGVGSGGPEGTVHIDISHNNLTGFIPSEIGYLENIQNLDLSANPNLGMTEGGNQALNPGLPTQIGLLSNLKALSLDHCGFSGTVPTQVGGLRSLQHFLLRGTTLGLEAVTNRFSGTIPTQVGKLSDVMHFGLGDNRISGTIPPQIGGMVMLRRFELQENQLTGSMPDAFKDLGKLEYWDTYGNQMTGDLPESIQNATSLGELYIQSAHTDVLRTFRCRQRIPGVGNLQNALNVPSKQAGIKYNWYVQVAEYYMYKYASACPDPFDPTTAFEALTGDV